MKTMRCLFLVFIVVAICPACAWAGEVNSNKKVSIAGRLRDPDALKKGATIIIEVYELCYKYGNAQKKYEQRIDEGNFSITIDPPGKYFHILFLYMVDGYVNQRYISGRNIYLDFFVAECGDSVYADIKNENSEVTGTAVFSGRGAEKYNCQASMFALSDNPVWGQEVFGKLTEEGKYQEYYTLLFKTRDSTVTRKMAILEKYSQYFSKDVGDIIYHDIIGVKNTRILYSLRVMYLAAANRQLGNAAKKAYYEYFKNRQTSTSPIAAHSFWYPDFLFELERLKFELESSDTVKHTYSIKDLVSKLNNNYTGLLRDKLLVYSFFATRDRDNGGFVLYDSIGNVVSDKKLRNILVSWKKSQEPGSKAFNFQLPDSSGKIYSLNEFSNKLVIVDFWFTGCVGCVKLSSFLKPIAEKYKGNDSVVFVSVNTDIKRSMWIKGLETGQYTFAGQIHLNTDGKGEDHQLLKYYNFIGAPQMLVIDKNGDLISASVPSYYDKETEMKFIKLIDDNLKPDYKSKQYENKVSGIGDNSN